MRGKSAIADRLRVVAGRFAPHPALLRAATFPQWGKALLRFLRVGAVQFLFDFLEDRVLGVVRVAADLAAGSAGMPAAAQTPRNVAGVGVVPGAHADLEAAVLLLAQGQTDLDALDGARQARQILQLSPGHTCGLDLVPGQADERTAVIVVKLQAF